MKAKQQPDRASLFALLRPLAKVVNQIPHDVSDEFVAHIYPYGVPVKVADLRAASAALMQLRKSAKKPEQ
jgi:hypothetical protein